MSVENFSWVIPKKIAGSAAPDFCSWRDDAVWLAEQGVCALVSLAMPYGPVKEECARHGIEWINYPIPDFSIPHDIASFNNLINAIIGLMNSDKGVCVHCHAGIGRTGLVLACVVGAYLALPSEQAITFVRQTRIAIETMEQEDFIRHFIDEQRA